ncbi:MAG: tetratricopeptide repeat protein [Rhodopirellula sp. JB044]|uniref:tetratricopeptide repeat protein n=1 Tax=Rhodopirellula sp. JB044 TaxID=3342844 RepID=UPI00370A3F0B
MRVSMRVLFAILLLQCGGVACGFTDEPTVDPPKPNAAGSSGSESSGTMSPRQQRDESVVSAEEIARLIEGLASDSYATRIRCRDRLMRIGLAAFDQLREARNHPDNEVAIVARRLTRGLRVQWSTASDSSEAKELLSEYGSHSISQRRSRIESLARLPRSDAFSPLLRLARFETEPVLARAAAQAVIALDSRDPNDARDFRGNESETARRVIENNRREFEASQIELALRQQKRISSQWLLRYAADLRQGHLDMNAWSELIQQNRSQLSPDDTGPTSEVHVSTSELLSLIWVTAERAIAHGVPADALGIVEANVDLIPSRTRALIETATWALQNKLYRAVIAMHASHSELYRKSPILLYSAAEAYSRSGQDDNAGQLADIALAINPLPERTDDQDEEVPADDGGPFQPNRPPPMHPQTIESHAQAHIEIATQLVERGLFQWAQKEYEIVIDRLPIDTAVSSFARLQLADMLGELLRHADVVKTLEPLTQRIDQDDEFRDRLISRRFSYTIVQSNMDYHRGLLLIEQGQLEAAQPVLRRAFEMNQENIDILIAMYRLDGDEQWKESVAQTLDEQIREAQSEVEDTRNSMQRAGPFRPAKGELAKRLNAYAWLVSNTEGDTERALRYSKESLRLTPQQPALMDTCARCYFAVGDIEAAIAMQKRACEEMPHSPPLERQLKEFEEALKGSRNESKPAG